MKRAVFFDYESKFSTKLRYLIEEKGITKQKLSEEIGVSRQAISQYCDGSTVPNADKFLKIAEFFDVSLDYLVGKTDAKISVDSDEGLLIRSLSDYFKLNNKSVEILEEICDYEHFGIVDMERYILGDCDSYIAKMAKHHVYVTPNQVTNSFLNSTHILDFFDEMASQILINTLDNLELKEQLETVDRLSKDLLKENFNEAVWDKVLSESRKLLRIVSAIEKNKKLSDLDLFDKLREITNEILPYPEDMIKRVYELEREIIGNHKKEE